MSRAWSASTSPPRDSTWPFTSTRTPRWPGNSRVGVSVIISVAYETFTDMATPAAGSGAGGQQACLQHAEPHHHAPGLLRIHFWHPPPVCSNSIPYILPLTKPAARASPWAQLHARAAVRRRVRRVGGKGGRNAPSWQGVAGESGAGPLSSKLGAMNTWLLLPLLLSLMPPLPPPPIPFTPPAPAPLPPPLPPPSAPGAARLPCSGLVSAIILKMPLPPPPPLLAASASAAAAAETEMLCSASGRPQTSTLVPSEERSTSAAMRVCARSASRTTARLCRSLLLPPLLPPPPLACAHA